MFPCQCLEKTKRFRQGFAIYYVVVLNVFLTAAVNHFGWPAALLWFVCLSVFVASSIGFYYLKIVCKLA